MKIWESGKIKFYPAVPLVVGVVTKKNSFLCANELTKDDCDVIEVRLDKVGNVRNWREQCRELEGKGFPVIVTIRSKKEGGDWEGDESLREKLLKQALDIVSSVDIELSSKLCAPICRYADQLGKKVIISYHNFSKTPSIAFLNCIISKMLSYPNTIPKIATTVTSDSDIKKLLNLLEVKKGRLKCILGMGDAGIKTRVIFPALGSCLTYGFIDSKCAPGQLSSPLIVNLLEQILPMYHRRKL